jgi:hypothetical protein
MEILSDIGDKSAYLSIGVTSRPNHQLTQTALPSRQVGFYSVHQPTVNSTTPQSDNRCKLLSLFGDCNALIGALTVSNAVIVSEDVARDGSTGPSPVTQWPARLEWRCALCSNAVLASQWLQDFGTMPLYCIPLTLDGWISSTQEIHRCHDATLHVGCRSGIVSIHLFCRFCGSGTLGLCLCAVCVGSPDTSDT